MTSEISETGFADLPPTIPVFPLAGVLLLPGGCLPLNIFEPRYLNMIRDAMAGAGIVGMIQPVVRERMEPDDHPELYPTGCAGRIQHAAETDDGRIALELAGICRFDVAGELPLENGYRRVAARYDRYLADIGGGAEAKGVAEAVDRDRLIAALKRYFAAQGMDGDWSAIDQTPGERLVTTLAMACPFGAAEKQALIECPDLAAMSETVITLLDMAAAGGGESAAH